jgi:hypothetical protein
MRFWTLMRAAGLLLGFIVTGGVMGSSCSMMNEPNDAAVGVGLIVTLCGWMTLVLLSRSAWRLGSQELERMQREYDARESKSGDEG